MKIGVLVNLTDIDSMPEKFENMVNLGFETCQLCSWNPSHWTDSNCQKLKDMISKNGIHISTFWCGWEGPSVWNFYEGHKTLGLLPPEYREMRIKNLCDGADFAKKLGVKLIATHMGFIPENPHDPEFEGLCNAVRTVAQHLEANGQKLLFETGQETPVTMLRCFETVDCNNLGINLDTANLILYGKANPVDALDVFGKYVCDIHAKDGLYPINGHDLGVETRLGDGKVDFKALFMKLKELNYDSYVTIEREILGEQQVADIKYAKGFLQNIIKEVYGG